MIDKKVLAKPMKRFFLTAKTASFGRIFQRWVVDEVKYWEKWQVLYLAKTKALSFCWVIQINFANYGVCNKMDDQCYVKFYITKKQAIFLCFSRLIKIFRRKNWILLRTQSNSYRCNSHDEHPTDKLYSKKDKINA